MGLVTKPLRNNNNSCYVCNTSPDIEYWDSGRDWQPAFPEPNIGRIYVCRECVDHAAREFGFLTPEAAQLLEDRNAYLEQEFEHLNIQTDLFKTIEKAVEELKLRDPVQYADFKVDSPKAKAKPGPKPKA